MNAEGLRLGEPPPSDVTRFDRLYGEHRRAVTAYCRRRMPADRVDDVVAETFLTAWRRLADVPEGEPALLWLYRVAYRLVGHEYRSTSRRRRLGLRVAALPSPVAPSPEQHVADDDEIQRVLQAAEQLNESDAEVLRLSGWEHLQHDEIAAVLGIAPNAVRQRLHRARRNLTKAYQRLESSDRTPAAPKGGTP